MYSNCISFIRSAFLVTVPAYQEKPGSDAIEDVLLATVGEECAQHVSD